MNYRALPRQIHKWRRRSRGFGQQRRARADGEPRPRSGRGSRRSRPLRLRQSIVFVNAAKALQAKIMRSMGRRGDWAAALSGSEILPRHGRRGFDFRT